MGLVIRLQKKLCRKEVWKIAIFDLHLALSRKWYNIMAMEDEQELVDSLSSGTISNDLDL